MCKIQEIIAKWIFANLVKYSPLLVLGVMLMLGENPFETLPYHPFVPSVRIAPF